MAVADTILGSTTSTSEVDALYAIYNATNGAHWTWTGVPWDFSQPDPDPCAEQWQGITCPDICTNNTCEITQIVLLGVNMSGYLPSALGAFPALTVLDIRSNPDLRGNIPSAVGLLTNLTALDLSANALSGTIPTELFALTQLVSLLLDSNQLNGTVSESIGSLTRLAYLDLSSNDLSGPLPSGLAQLTAMSTLYLDDNLFTALPAISSLSNLTICDVDNNMIMGDLPDLTGLRQLQGFAGSFNLFSGTLPNWSDCTAMTGVFLIGNTLHGPIPSTWGDMTAVKALVLDKNLLSGQVPQSLQNVTEMTLLLMNDNRFTGPFTVQLDTMPAVALIDLEDNYFSGEVDFLPTAANQIAFINVSNNLFHGTAAGFSKLMAVQIIDASNNALSGPLRSIDQLPNLTTLFIWNNALTGPLTGFLNATYFPKLSTLDISGNRLTGSLPAQDIAQLPSLVILAVVQNCFTGSISEALCNAPQISILALDGMSTATTCRLPTLAIPEISSYVFRNNYVGGHIPACLFTMPTLTLLHLSGNGFDGTIPVTDSLGPLLNDLSLSHNILTGTIPDVLQSGERWTTLDLSFNRFNGFLSSGLAEYANNASISLQSNRLSGRIPGRFFPLTDIDMLRSNIFRCDSGGVMIDVPAADPYHDEYQCGSDTLNAALISWMTVVTVLAIAAVLVGYQAQRHDGAVNGRCGEFLHNTQVVISTLSRWLSTTQSESALLSLYAGKSILGSLHLSHISSACALLRDVCRFVLLVAAVLLLIVLPIYTGLTVGGYGSYSFQYGWTASAAFLSGQAPAITLFFIFVLLLVIVRYGNVMCHQSLPRPPHRLPSISIERLLPQSSYHMKMGLVALVDMFVVMLVNGFFVYSTARISAGALVAVSIVLSLFKLVWGRVLFMFIVRYLKEDATAELSTKLIWFYSCLMLFNTILAPCFATFLASSDCFYYVFAQPPTITTSYSIQACDALNGTSCSHTVWQTTSINFQPPFQYSFQCSSAFLTHYGYVYVYKYLLIGVLFPLLVLLMSFYVQAHSVDGQPSTKLSRYCEMILPPLWKSFQASKPADTATGLVAWVQPFMDDAVLSAPDYAVRLAMMLGTVLTFGVVLPYLALLILVAVWSNTYLTQVGLARVLEKTASDEKHLTMLENVCKQCQRLREALQIAVRPLPALIAVFYSAFVFDIAGDVMAAWIALFFSVGTWIAAMLIFALPPTVFVTSSNRTEPDGTVSVQVSVDRVSQGVQDDEHSVSNPIL